MSKVEVDYTKHLDQMCARLRRPGALLASVDPQGRPNVMTIGWGTIGIVWGRPVFIVLVRPSRYTFQCIEATEDFTVNIPSPDMAKIVAACGTLSGRDHDKFAEQGLTPAPALKIKSPIVQECPLNFECKVAARNDLIGAGLAGWVEREYYPEGDLHRVYFGEILCVRADEDAAERLGS